MTIVIGNGIRDLKGFWISRQRCGYFRGSSRWYMDRDAGLTSR